MHCEHFFVTRELIEELLLYNGRTIAVGTTSVRTLESIYWLGAGLIMDPHGNDDLIVGQWDPYIKEEHCFPSGIDACFAEPDEKERHQFSARVNNGDDSARIQVQGH